MQFSFAQLAILAITLQVASAAPALDSTGLERRDAYVHSREVLDIRKSSNDDDDKKPSSPKKSKAKATSAKKSKAKATSAQKSKSSKPTASPAKSNGSSASKPSSGSKPLITSPASSGNSSTGTTGCKIPASSGSSALAAVMTIAAGQHFDCGMVMYDRGVKCTGQAEGGDKDAVFQIESGGSLSNCVIGPNQIEGVHCQGLCKLTNVWWSAVCEDAFTIKNQKPEDTTYISGGGACGAEDKVLQHNGAGSLSLSDFTVDTFGKLYRSCGNCKTMFERHVIMDNIHASSGKELAGINYNFNDTATFTNIFVHDVEDICVEFTGTDDNSVEPSISKKDTSDQFCVYKPSDIHTF